MNNYDGSIVIDTQLDITSVEFSLKSLHDAIKKELSTAFDNISVKSIITQLSMVETATKSLKNAISQNITSAFSSMSQSVVGSLSTLKSKITQLQTGNANAIGKPLVQGIINGINAEKINLQKRMQSLLNSTLTAGKKEMGIQSPSRVMRDEIGKMMVYGLRDGIAQNSDVVVAQFNKMLDLIQYQRDFDIISEDAYYTKLEELRNRYFAVGSQQWLKHTEKIYEYQQKMLQQQKSTIVKTYETMAKEAEKAISEIEKKQESFEKRLKKNDYLFVNHTLEDADGNVIDKIGTLRSFQSEIDKVNEYQRALDAVKAKLGDSGEAKAVYEQLLSLGMEEGKLFADAINRASQGEIDQYLQGFMSYQNTIKKVSKDEFADEWAEIQGKFGNLYQRFEQSLIDTFGTIPQEFLENGKLSAEQFGKGFLENLSEISNTISENALSLATPEVLQQQQADGKAYGESFATGIKESKSAFATTGEALKNSLSQIFKTVPDGFFSIGQDSAESFELGFLDRLKSTFATLQTAMGTMTPSFALAGGNVNSYSASYNFYSSGQTVSQQLRDARAQADMEKLRS